MMIGMSINQYPSNVKYKHEMDVDKHLTQQTTSLLGKFLVTLKEMLWSSSCRDSLEQANDAKSKTQDDNLDEVVCALESLLHENISFSHLQDVDQFLITPIQHCQQLESWDCGKCQSVSKTMSLASLFVFHFNLLLGLFFRDCLPGNDQQMAVSTQQRLLV